jgi:hypothetical protein
MPATLSWLDHDSAERDRMNRVLALFQERRTVDELGLGAIRDAIADKLFPGTSTIQTRLRYFLFVPWVYQDLEEKQIGTAHVTRKARELELRVAEPLLMDAEQAGIFGRVAGKGLKRLPSGVYWGGLGAWGLRRFNGSQDQYHRALDEIYRRRRVVNRRDDGDREFDRSVQTWHPALPAAPAGFPDQLDIRLTREEAEFIRDRIRSECGNSFLRVVADADTAIKCEWPWEAANARGARDEHRVLLHHARVFGNVRYPATILYNLMLAEMASAGDLIDVHRASLDEWAATFNRDEVAEWSLTEFWALVENQGHTITPRAREFVTKLRAFTLVDPRGIAESAGARQLVKAREMMLKGPKSRFTNARVREERWGGYAGIYKLDYRWRMVSNLMADLHDGLRRKADARA